jgi:hypothetical protein
MPYNAPLMLCCTQTLNKKKAAVPGKGTATITELGKSRIAIKAFVRFPTPVLTGSGS